MILIGIDIGSSFIKGGVLDLDEPSIRDVVREPFPEPIAGLPSGHFEIAPSAVVAAVEQVLQRLLMLAPDCSRVLFCGQMGGIVLTDHRGEPITNYFSWRDQRATTHRPASVIPQPERHRTFLEDVVERLGHNELAAVGNELKSGSATTLLSWLAESGPLPAQAVPLDLGDFVVGRLCRTKSKFEVTQAAGLLDLATGDWRRSAFEKLAIDRLAWPAVTDFRTPVGSIRSDGREIPCHACVGDQQAALAGALLGEGELSLNISTGSQVSLLTREVRIGQFQTRPFFDQWWLNTMTHLPAGRAMDALLDLLTELPRAEGLELRDPWGVISQDAERSSDSDLDVSLTFFAGPLGNRGHIKGITLDNLTIGHLFRAAFRGMAENYDQCAALLSPERAWSRIVFSGGLAQKLPLLRDFIVERLNAPFRMCPSSEDTLFGLLVLGQVLSGRAKDVTEAATLAAS